MPRNPLEQFGITAEDLTRSAEADAGLDAFMRDEFVPYARDLAKGMGLVESGDYVAGIKVTKKARAGKGTVSATDWKSHFLEFGTGAPGPTNVYAVMEKTAQHFGGSLDAGVNVDD